MVLSCKIKYKNPLNYSNKKKSGKQSEKYLFEENYKNFLVTQTLLQTNEVKQDSHHKDSTLKR
jgi:hypothetical protein